MIFISSISDPDPVGSMYFDRLGSPTVSDFFFWTYAFKRNFFSMKFLNRVMGTYFFYCFVYP